jgi:hypothetical protein
VAEVFEGPGEFDIKDCALIAIATGRRVHSLNEFRDALLTVGEDSIYYHFWGSLLQPRFEEREFNNDFAGWVFHHIHDGALAERLAVIDPTQFPDLDELRHEVIELVEQRLDEGEYLSWVRAPEAFEFLRSQIVVFDSDKRAERPEDLAELLPHLPPSSVFYHFVDARRRSADRVDDFRKWVSFFGPRYELLVEHLSQLDPYFVPLTQLRTQLADVFIRTLKERADA